MSPTRELAALLAECSSRERNLFLIGWAMAKQRNQEEMTAAVHALYAVMSEQFRNALVEVSNESLQAGIESALAGLTAARNALPLVGKPTGAQSDADLAAAVSACLNAMHLARGRRAAHITVTLSDPPADSQPSPCRIEFILHQDQPED